MDVEARHHVAVYVRISRLHCLAVAAAFAIYVAALPSVVAREAAHWIARLLAQLLLDGRVFTCLPLPVNGRPCAAHFRQRLRRLHELECLAGSFLTCSTIFLRVSGFLSASSPPFSRL